MNDMHQITRLLREEVVLQNRHCRLLEAQQRALLACDREQFRIIQTEYAVLVERLKAQVEARTAALCDAEGKPMTLAALIEAASGQNRPALEALRDELAQPLEQAQTLCRRNQMLIENELNYIAFSLDLFVEAGRRADISYGGSGRGSRRKILDRRA